MTEQSIFQYLLGDNFYNQDNRDIHPLLIMGAASGICDRLAEDVNIIAKNPSYPAHYLRDNLVLISKLLRNDDNHHQVNRSNRSLVLRCLEKSYNKYKSGDEMEDILNECVQEIKTKKKLMLSRIRERILKVQENKEQSTTLLIESIRMNVKQLERSTGLEFTPIQLPKVLPKWNVTYSTYKSLENVEDTQTNQGKFERTINFRLKQIQFGYALLNVGHTEELSTHLSFLLKNLTGYEVMHMYERRFCKYLFRFIDKYPDLLEFYRDALFFVLEMQIINTCRNLIKITEVDINRFIIEQQESDEFISLKTACKWDTVVYRKVKKMLYTLYYYSNFNGRILRLIKNFDDFILT